MLKDRDDGTACCSSWWYSAYYSLEEEVGPEQALRRQVRFGHTDIPEGRNRGKFRKQAGGSKTRLERDLV